MFLEQNSWNPIVNVTITLSIVVANQGKHALFLHILEKGKCQPCEQSPFVSTGCLHGDFCSWDHSATDKSSSIITANENDLLKHFISLTPSQHSEGSGKFFSMHSHKNVVAFFPCLLVTILGFFFVLFSFVFIVVKAHYRIVNYIHIFG